MKIKATDDFLRDLHQPADKCLVVGEPEMLVLLEEKLRQELGKRINVYRSEAFYLELVPKGIDKAASLSRLLAKVDEAGDYKFNRGRLQCEFAAG